MSANRSRLERILRQHLGPTMRVQHIERAGLSGMQLIAEGRVVVQTFDVSGDRWGKLASLARPWLLHLERRGAA